MKLNPIKPRKALNKAYLKLKANRSQIESFKTYLIELIDTINEKESEEFHKNLVSDFLKKTYYSPNHFINTKGRNDLVIHNGKNAKSTVGVIIEAKKPTNKGEMLKIENINKKAFQELVLYYLRERITQKNLEVKYLIVTNIYEWFVFDAQIFDRLFAQNKNLVKQFTDFEENRLADSKTDFFYNDIAEPFINDIKSEITFTHYDIREYDKPLRNDDKKDDIKLIALFKLFSPEHLLKLPFTNDNNTLDKRFYTELLHIIGLNETKEGSKKLIGRKSENERNPGSLIENAINILKYEDCLSQIKASHYGDTKEEQYYHVGLELVITWMNRILFLKLLEGQLIKYHKGDTQYKFLNLELIPDYDALNKLFFQVLAIKEDERNDLVKKKFSKIPYLNSSLFEPNDLEHKTIRISNLEDEYSIPILNTTVLKGKTGKKLSGEKNTLEYFFKFLDAFDFASEGSEEIQEDDKKLINASVLGLIFEKINGYKDGSFFTPGFITMYMCRETVRRAVVQKFNEAKGWKCKDTDELYDKIEDRNEANKIINSLKICDPAVGSGHFLVSALNEIIAIKNDLKVLQDSEGKRLKEYHVEVVNDELIVTDEDGEFFEYNPNSPESQRVQKALFHEKQTIIENCLFGVDINFNSVKICRLRLWIELLKNAYYKPGTEELETLPNIDINIKCGNSLISRYALDADIKKALKKSKWTIDSYRLAVMTYRNAQNKEEKKAMQKLINEIKNDFESEIAAGDKRVFKLNTSKGKLLALTTQTQMFEQSKKEKAEWNKNVSKFTTEIEKLETELKEIKNNKIYENAFEWRFEFPEVLNVEGVFVGFDVVIGNPPYIQQRKLKGATILFNQWYSVYSGTADLSVFFFERAFNILKEKGQFSFISTNKFFNTEYGKPLRNYLSSFRVNEIVNFELVPIFDEALVSSVIITIDKDQPLDNFKYLEFLNENIDQDKFYAKYESGCTSIDSKLLMNDFWLFTKINEQKLISKLKKQGYEISSDESIQIRRGITTGFDNAFIINEKSSIYNSKIARKFLRGKDIHRYKISDNKLNLLFIPWHFPLHKDDSINGASKTAENEFESTFPDEYNHLTSFKSELSRRNKSETGLRYEWYALQRCAASYYDLFDKEKIVWGLISGGWDFALDINKNLLTSASFFLTSDIIPVKYILALFNSKLYQFYFSIIGEKTAGGAFVFKKATIEKFIIPQNKNFINEIIERIDEIQNRDREVNIIESEIDQLIYQLYGLTEDEIEIVEKS